MKSSFSYSVADAGLQFFSQSFMHGAGLTVVGSTTGQGSNSDIGFGEGFYYFPVSTL